MAGCWTHGARNRRLHNDLHVVRRARFAGFDVDKVGPVADSDEACTFVMARVCQSHIGPAARAVLCDSQPEGAARREAPSRPTRNDADGYRRSFEVFACSDDGTDELETLPVPDPFESSPHACSDSSKGPFLCLQVTPQWGPHLRSRCKCWPRLDWRGLSESPHYIPSLSDRFPLDRQYPSTPRAFVP